MKEERVLQLIEKINKEIHRGEFNDSSVSPTQKLSEGGEKSTSSDFPLLTPYTRLENLSKNNLYLIHVMLHKFYSTRRNTYLTKGDIKELHRQVKPLINHSNFDKLDNDE